ncbi:TonB family protein [Psychrobacter sp.]|uniref:TonB family protein n=1 Tax=Psychrobacter sp. TaxID=56811 RepID=UPI0025E5F002|nr:TonB family protein [Psychrobacter sp.]
MKNKIALQPSSIKVKAITILAVFALHIGAALFLLNIDMPKLTPKKLEIKKPIQIQLLNIPDKQKLEVTEVKPKLENMPKLNQSASKPEMNAVKLPKSEPVNKLNLKPVTKPKPKVEKIDTFKKARTPPEPKHQTQTKKSPIVEHDAINDKPKVIMANNEQQRLIDQAAKQKEAQQKAAQEQATQELAAKQKAVLDRAAAERAAQEKAVAERAAQEKAAQEQASKERVAQQKAAADKAAAVQAAKVAADSNTPQRFSASDARWQRKPKYLFPDQVRRTTQSQTYTVSLDLIVDKQGNVTSVSIVTSSGNNTIDKAAVYDIRRGKFHPFIKNGMPVIGIVTLPVNYKLD